MKYQPLVLKKMPNEKKWWMNPNGSLFLSTVNHLISAIGLSGDVEDPFVALWKRGWQRIVQHKFKILCCCNELMPPNDIQRTKLIELAIENECDEIEFDNGKDVHVLWSKDDVL